MNLEELMASTPPMQQHALIKGFQAGAASRDAEVAELVAALEEIKSPVEFWISCHTEFEPDYSALLVLINKKLAKVRKP